MSTQNLREGEKGKTALRNKWKQQDYKDKYIAP